MRGVGMSRNSFANASREGLSRSQGESSLALEEGAGAREPHMNSARWIKVDATIVECFRAWGEPWRAAHPWFEIVADIEPEPGAVERVSSRQRLNTHTHDWRAPDPGDTVRAKWDAAHRTLRLELGGDARYDLKVIKRLGRNREPPSWGPFGGSSMP